MFDPFFSIDVTKKDNKLKKDVQDIYNDMDIMKINPPYPYIPTKIGDYYKENHFPIEIVAYLNKKNKIIEYSIGVDEIITITSPNLQDLITRWNNYCYYEISKKHKDDFKVLKKLILKIFTMILIITIILGFYASFSLLGILGVLWHYIISPKYETKYIEKETRKEFNRIIDGTIRLYSRESIKVAIIKQKFSDSINIPLSDSNEKNTKIEEDNNSLAIENLETILNKLQNMPSHMLNFKYKEEYIGSLTFINIIKNVRKNYDLKSNKIISEQLEKDIIKYSDNFIKALDLISVYRNKSNADTDKEINDLLCNYYVIFNYFDKSLLKNNDLSNISKLKVLNQDSKMYRDYIEIIHHE